MRPSIASAACASVQKQDGVAIYIDNEHKYDLDYGAVCGIDLDRFLFTQPSTVEDSFTILNETIHLNDVYSFYQAKSIKQHTFDLGRKALELQYRSQKGLQPPQPSRD